MPFANNNGVKIHYEIEGQGPPILLQHGFSGTLDSWRTNGYIQALSTDYRCIFLSARGRGESDKPHDPKAYYFKNMVLDLVAVLDDLKINKAHYLGYSMGGAIGFRIPMYAPERFYSLILGGAAYVSGNTTKTYADLGPAYDTLEQAVAEGRDNPMAIFLTIFEKNLGAMAPQQRAATLLQDAKAITAAWRARKEESSPEATDYLARFTLPCLLYAGENDPRCTDARETARQISVSRFFSLPGLNHTQTNAHSELITPHVKIFLAEVNKKQS
ncbi:MAG: putative hydrolase or acyltransferase of alpha/beta superfamily [Dehalococcoidales bacterium]|nr:putative hydrolase or acyltransferase of alpha/beta superfamily [Dehalococcoidales bacterium]